MPPKLQAHLPFYAKGESPTALASTTIGIRSEKEQLRTVPGQKAD